MLIRDQFMKKQLQSQSIGKHARDMKITVTVSIITFKNMN